MNVSTPIPNTGLTKRPNRVTSAPTHVYGHVNTDTTLRSRLSGTINTNKVSQHQESHIIVHTIKESNLCQHSHVNTIVTFAPSVTSQVRQLQRHHSIDSHVNTNRVKSAITDVNNSHVNTNTVTSVTIQSSQHQHSYVNNSRQPTVMSAVTSTPTLSYHQHSHVSINTLSHVNTNIVTSTTDLCRHHNHVNTGSHVNINIVTSTPI